MTTVQRYAGKVVCITGSSRGIGQRLAVRFAEEGANVVVHYFRNTAAAKETAKMVEETGQEALVVKANLTQPDKIQVMFQEIRAKFGRLDVFIHNASSGRSTQALELDSKGWDWTQDVNAKAFLLGVQHAVKLMKDGGAVLAISSFGADHVFPYYTSIGASKAALESLVRYFAVELANKRINANAISAGAVVTGTLKNFPDIEKTWAQMEHNLPYPRMVNADDVAEVALFLCSPQAEMLRGQSVRVDGGLTLKMP